jgi:hypothetical protein
VEAAAEGPAADAGCGGGMPEDRSPESGGARRRRQQAGTGRGHLGLDGGGAARPHGCSLGSAGAGYRGSMGIIGPG